MSTTARAFIEHEETDRPTPLAVSNPLASFNAFAWELVTIERHRRSTTQGEVSVGYAGHHLGRFHDPIELVEREHGRGADWLGAGDGHWIEVARLLLARRFMGEVSADQRALLEAWIAACKVAEPELRPYGLGMAYLLPEQAQGRGSRARRAFVLLGQRVVEAVPQCRGWSWVDVAAVLNARGGFRLAF